LGLYDIILHEVMIMKLEDKLQLLRKKNGYSQEQLADKLGVARQTISKWENGQALPELSGVILLSELYGVTIDRIVKGDDECNISLSQKADVDINTKGDKGYWSDLAIEIKEYCETNNINYINYFYHKELVKAKPVNKQV